MSRYALLFLLLLVLLSQTSALNILVLISLPLRSHYMAIKTLFRELAIRGHNVTVINNFPDEHPTPRLEFINLLSHDKSVRRTQALETYESFSSWYLHLYNIYRHIQISPGSTTAECEKLFTDENMKQHLARGTKYDVIFVEQFMSDCDLAYAGMHYDAPIIGITSHVLLPKHYYRLGIPYDISVDPHYFTNGGTERSLYRKVETAVVDFFFHTLFKWTLEKRISDVFAKYMPNKKFDLEKLSHERMKMIFSNQHYSITGGRLLAPKLLEIGGIHIQKPKTVPKDIEEFISSSEKGVIYVSFGSLLHASTMSAHKRQQFLDAFKRIPQKVIWKWENASLPKGNDNVLTSSWLPQLDILCHPNVLAFISHGGMLSMSEAAHCGTPLLTLPFFGDQFNNAASARESGLGITLFFQQINSENLVEAIKELTSEKMQSNAKRVSRLWHDRPLPVMDSAIYWTEYVARHRDAPPALPTEQTTWFQTTQLDVLCIIIAITIAILYLIYAIIIFFIRRIFRLLVKLLCKDKKE
ncbi:UDP-glycosyltransferase UGT5-like [Choristoneura fumiferana]|uniref:UDP-glycosyltransferase UGT5-like n=1 Tax=Choristoneura fumiferana TaxID=7141 RepID=UPI003D15511C